MATIDERVEELLMMYPDVRDNDTLLRAKYMNKYHWVDLTVWQVEKMVKSWVSYASIIRIRSLYQNKYKLYQASDEVKELRKQQKSKYRDRYSKSGRDK